MWSDCVTVRCAVQGMDDPLLGREKRFVEGHGLLIGFEQERYESCWFVYCLIGENIKKCDCDKPC